MSTPDPAQLAPLLAPILPYLLKGALELAKSAAVVRRNGRGGEPQRWMDDAGSCCAGYRWEPGHWF